MLEEKDLQAIAQLIHIEIAPVHTRLDNLENRFENPENKFDELEDRFDKLEGAACRSFSIERG